MGGKDIRTRSAFRIGESYQIDLNMDTNWQMHRYGVDIYDIEHSQVFASHINPHQGLLHDGLQQQLDTNDFSITVAYDGLAF